MQPLHTVRRLLLLLVAGALAGTASGLLIHQTHGVLSHRDTALNDLRAQGLAISAPDLARFVATKHQLQDRDTALTVGLIGLIFCVTAGLGRGALTRSFRTAGCGAVGGALLGLGLGALGGFADARLDAWLRDYSPLDPMYQAMIKHSAAWIAVAVAVGLTAVLPARHFGTIARMLLPMVMAGVAAGVVFVPISAIVFPEDIAEFAVPTGIGNRILWTTLPAVLMAWALDRVWRVTFGKSGI